MTFRDLHAAMMRLALKFKLVDSYGYYGYYTDNRRRAQIESVAHELAHGVDLVGRPMSSVSVGRVVSEMADRAADQHELRVQRIEVLALRALGVRVCARTMAARAEWRRGTDPSRRALAGELTKREQRGVALFLAIVLTEAGEL